jgi:predicted cupin superfamily sugar epimerase
MSKLAAKDVIFTLGMERHPEGGWYARTFEDQVSADGRAQSTAIYYLLEAGDASHWHRVDAVEVWHYYAGAPLNLRISDGKTVVEHRLGNDLDAGERPQSWCRAMPGSRLSARVAGRWWDARWRRASSSPDSSWPTPIGSRGRINLSCRPR